MKNKKDEIGKRIYNIHDVIKAEFNLEPLQCLHCKHIGEVTYNQKIKDGLCEHCGRWQLDT